jgi:hypothetical protein
MTAYAWGWWSRAARETGSPWFHADAAFSVKRCYAETLGELSAIKRGAPRISLEREVLPYRTEARRESLNALRHPEATHPALVFARGLMVIFRTAV